MLPVPRLVSSVVVVAAMTPLDKKTSSAVANMEEGKIVGEIGDWQRLLLGDSLIVRVLSSLGRMAAIDLVAAAPSTWYMKQKIIRQLGLGPSELHKTCCAAVLCA